jgi:hypothetical protein
VGCGRLRPARASLPNSPCPASNPPARQPSQQTLALATCSSPSTYASGRAGVCLHHLQHQGRHRQMAPSIYSSRPGGEGSETPAGALYIGRRTLNLLLEQQYRTDALIGPGGRGKTHQQKPLYVRRRYSRLQCFFSGICGQRN